MDSIIGQRVLAFARHASPEGVTAQFELLDQRAGSAAVCVTQRISQINGTPCISRESIRSIIDVAGKGPAITFLLVLDPSRLTRRGMDHLHHLLMKLAQARISVVFADQLSAVTGNWAKH